MKKAPKTGRGRLRDDMAILRGLRRQEMIDSGMIRAYRPARFVDRRRQADRMACRGPVRLD